MKSINRFIYGPTPEEKVKKWQGNLRQQERHLEREVLNVSGSSASSIEFYHGHGIGQQEKGTLMRMIRGHSRDPIVIMTPAQGLLAVPALTPSSTARPRNPEPSSNS
jgi:hypothetical protein